MENVSISKIANSCNDITLYIKNNETDHTSSVLKNLKMV